MKIKVIASSNVYKYAMFNRPVSIGTCPKDYVAVEDRPAQGKDHYTYARHGIVVYNRRLTDAETKNFELAYIADGEERIPFAKLIAEDMKRYAKQYVNQYETKPLDFISKVKDDLRSCSEGYMPSVGDIEDFSKLVVIELKRFI